jgi:hypothetical protein
VLVPVKSTTLPVTSITGSITGSVVDFTGTSTNIAIPSITGAIAGKVIAIGTSNSIPIPSIIGAITGNVIDFIGTSNNIHIPFITGTILGNASVGISGTSISISVPSITGSITGQIVDFIGTSNGSISITGLASGVRGESGSSLVASITISGAITGSIGEAGSSVNTLSLITDIEGIIQVSGTVNTSLTCSSQIYGTIFQLPVVILKPSDINMLETSTITIQNLMNSNIFNVNTPTFTVDCSEADYVRLNLMSDTALTFINTQKEGQKIMLALYQADDVVHNVTFGSNVRFGSDEIALPTLSQEIEKLDRIAFIYDAESDTLDMIGLARGY